MSTVSKINTTLVQNAVCEIQLLKQGNLSCANDMLVTRIECENRIQAMQCLIDTGDSQYNDLVSFLYEQIKELSNKLTIKI